MAPPASFDSASHFGSGDFHCARHTWATFALAAGRNVRWVADVLGYADPALTLRVYAHAMPVEAADLSFAEFGRGSERESGDPGRPYTAPGSKPASESKDAAAVSACDAKGIGGVSEGNRTPDLQGHNLAL